MLADTAIAGRPSYRVLQVRRFLCSNTGCDRCTFVEQIDVLPTAYARTTPLLREIFEKIALALAGRAGSRLASTLGVSVGRSTLLRLVRALPDPPTTTVEVLGIDDFALRRRHRYGTILIDMSPDRPVDVLADRTAGTVAAWLRGHPGTEVICRDRVGAYAEAAGAGAPEAIEVADRWHLWHNLAEAVEKTVAAHHHCLKKEPELEPEPLVERTAAEQLRMAAEQVHATRQESSILAVRTKQRFEAVTTLKNEGIGIRMIVRQLGLARETVRCFYYASSVDELLGAPRAGRPTMLDRFAVHLHERLNDGCTSAAALYKELRTLGCRGSYRLETTAHPRCCAGQKTGPEGPADHILDVASPRQPHRRRADRPQTDPRQLPTHRSNCGTCHFVCGDAHRTPWETIELVDGCRRGR